MSLLVEKISVRDIAVIKLWVASCSLTLAGCLLLAGCAAPRGSEAEDLAPAGETYDYSLTQTVDNKSSEDLTVQSAIVDNGAQMVPGSPSVVRAGTSGVFKSTNIGTGMTMSILMSTATNCVYLVSDVPHTEANYIGATILENDGKLSAGDVSIEFGNEPKASFTVNSAAGGFKQFSSDVESPWYPNGPSFPTNAVCGTIMR